MPAQIHMEEIKELLQQDNLAGCKAYLENWLPSELAELIVESDDTERAFVFKSIDRERAFETFESLDVNLQKSLLDVLPSRQVQLILNDMSPDDRTALLEEIDPELLNRLLKLLTPKERAIALSLLGYPENSIGRLMTPDYIAIRKHWSVRYVLDYIRENGENSETLNVIYIVDERGHLIDDIKVAEILLADLNTPIENLMDGKYTALSVTDDEEVAIGVFKKLNRVALPVVNSSQMLLGIITIDDVLQLAEEETTEDIQKLGGVEALEEPYMEMPLPKLLRKRAPWLIILFIGEMFTASAMSFFENEIERAVVLALFIPLIVSSGGNSGSQAATLIIRALALGEVTLKDWWRVMRREIISGLILGLILGFIGFLRVAAWATFTNIYGPHWMLIGITIGITLVGVCTWGTVMGSMLPIILKRFGADPATSSAPFIATLVDVTGLVIYFSIAATILSGTLL
ncbi:MAG TPA: magnesium transporter [Bacteroidia bacterium]|nr:magnesium transporter [Bacteroidia bacterium]MCB0849930.1 magnesium transporter [Bacteroidota bacterium]MCO5288901.1 magnesium transporter [Bacteroidota bacterium]HNR49398.1 magnesium transporter [Bacteroidia bacterium]